LLNVSNPAATTFGDSPGVSHLGSDPRGVTIRMPLASVDQW